MQNSMALPEENQIMYHLNDERVNFLKENGMSAYQYCIQPIP